MDPSGVYLRLSSEGGHEIRCLRSGFSCINYIEAGSSSTAKVPLRHRWETAYLEASGAGPGDNASALSLLGPSRWEHLHRMLGINIRGLEYTTVDWFFFYLSGFFYYYDTPFVFRYAVASEFLLHSNSTAKVLLRHRWDGVLDPGMAGDNALALSLEPAWWAQCSAFVFFLSLLE